MADILAVLPQQLTDGDTRPLKVLFKDNGDGSFTLATRLDQTTIDGLAASGLATALKQDTTNIKLDDLITAVGGISGGSADPFAGYKYSDSTTVSNVDYVGKVNATGEYIVTSYDAAGSAQYSVGASGYTYGAGFGAWADGLTYGDYEDVF